MPPDEKRIRTLVIDDAFYFMQAICSFLENLGPSSITVRPVVFLSALRQRVDFPPRCQYETGRIGPRNHG
jgi:hypothetical protein